MALHVYNTLTRKKEPFEPLEEGKVRMFVCGPTVYDYAHLGHAKCAVSFDIVARYLRHKGYSVLYIQNITDIDDKIIARANEGGKDPLKLAREFEAAYIEDMRALGVHSVDRYPRAMEHLPQIQEQISRMLQRGIAYQLSDGVYFDLTKFPQYGKLSRQNLAELKKARIEPHPDKRNPGDFSLWKAAKPGEPSWNSPFGAGRPGWHIEDTAITEHLLGEQYDLHGGGQDLIFPHHEAEIAQMESLSGKPLVKYWMHNGFVTVNNEKMSKSLGNFLTIRDVLATYDAEAVRLFLLSSHYRDPLSFTHERMAAARNTLQGMRDLVVNLQDALHHAKAGDAGREVGAKLAELSGAFEAAMDDDFNTAEALKALHALRDYANTYLADTKRTRGGVEEILEAYRRLAGLLGLLEGKEVKLPLGVTEQWITLKVKERQAARAKKDFKAADRARDELKAKGILLEDTSEGVKWKVAV